MNIENAKLMGIVMMPTHQIISADFAIHFKMAL